jgi:hypothetical protein
MRQAMTQLPEITARLNASLRIDTLLAAKGETIEDVLGICAGLRGVELPHEKSEHYPSQVLFGEPPRIQEQ